MKKEKTITIKHFVNFDVKPKMVDGDEFYPVYTQIVYNRKNTKFKTKISGDPILVKKELELKDSNYLNKSNDILNQNDKIETIIRYEESILNDSFSLKGIGNRLVTYNSPIINIYKELYKNSSVEKYLKSVLTYDDYTYWDNLEDINSQIEQIYYYDFKTGGNYNGLILSGMPKKIKEQLELYEQMKLFFEVAFTKNDITIYEWFFKKGRSQTLVYLKEKNNEINPSEGVKAFDKLLKVVIGIWNED